jgi:hypothetical protein
MTKCALCIGAPRSGTSWLYGNLRQHPDIFLPPVKEVRQFVSCRSNPERDRTAQRVIDDSGSTANDIAWTRKWLMSNPRNVDDYSALMRHTVPAPVVMDISPVYCIASPEIIEKFKAALGTDIRIIFLMRNPIERDFSHAKLKFHMYDGETKALPINSYLQFLQGKNMQERNGYLRTLKQWSEVFGREAIHLEFYDSIVAEPMAVLARVTAHIGVAAAPDLFSETSSQRFADAAAFNLVPQELKTTLAEMHIDKIAELARTFPNPCARWLEDAEKLLAHSSSMNDAVAR